jgi:hypothetical protein
MSGWAGAAEPNPNGSGGSGTGTVMMLRPVSAADIEIPENFFVVYSQKIEYRKRMISETQNDLLQQNGNVHLARPSQSQSLAQTNKLLLNNQKLHRGADSTTSLPKVFAFPFRKPLYFEEVTLWSLLQFKKNPSLCWKDYLLQFLFARNWRLPAPLLGRTLSVAMRRSPETSTNLNPSGLPTLEQLGHQFGKLRLQCGDQLRKRRELTLNRLGLNPRNLDEILQQIWHRFRATGQVRVNLIQDHVHQVAALFPLHKRNQERLRDIARNVVRDASAEKRERPLAVFEVCID